MESNNIRIFIRTSIIIFLVFTLLLLVFGIAYAHASLKVYNIVLLFFIALIGICIIWLMLMSGAIIYAYRSKKVRGLLLKLTKSGMQIMLPLALLLFKRSKIKKSIRLFYIELNNLVVESENNKYKAEEVMLLLPHCIQNSQCVLKVTNNAKFCEKCGRCKVGELLEYTAGKNIRMFIATGGTVARKIIKENNPKLIISVACERDLMSGILDVKGIPVIGVTNIQPMGPCFNTDDDIAAIKQRVEQLIY